MNRIKMLSKNPCCWHWFPGAWAAPSALLISVLAGCANVPKPELPVLIASSRQTTATAPARPSTVLPPAGSGRGAYYQDDGPGENPPMGLLELPNAEPRIESLSKGASRPYVVFGKNYTPITDGRAFVQRGVGSWYGKKFHGQKTASGELYDMYKMTAAHPTLPIPSYARITNIHNGRQVIVRINDRGPFHASRIVDLSYTAAMKLDLLTKGSHEVEIERILPTEIERLALRQREQKASINPPALVSAKPSPISDGSDDDRSKSLVHTASVVQAQIPVPVTSAASDSSANALIDNFNGSQKAQGFVHANAFAVSGDTSNSIKGGFYLQLGAYAQAHNAESVRVKLTQNWPTTGAPVPEIVQSGVIYRLYSGPFLTRSEAATAAQLVLEGGSSRALIVQR